MNKPKNIDRKYPFTLLLCSVGAPFLFLLSLIMSFQGTYHYSFIDLIVLGVWWTCFYYSWKEQMSLENHAEKD